MSAYLSDAGVNVGQTRTAYSELRQLNSKYGEIAADAGLAGAGMLPPPFGTAADVASLGRSLWKGNWGDALFDVVGLVPIIGDGAKAGRIANKLNDLRKALDVANTGMKRVFQSTKKAAGRYWDDMVKANRAKYADAIKGCGNNKACREAKAYLKGPQYKNTPTSGKNGSWSGERGDGVWTPTNGGPPITYKNGFPDYGPHSAASVEIPMKGNSTDFTKATNASEDTLRDMYGDNWRNGWKDDYSWHHKEDGVTMELVPRNIHATGGGASTPHMGGSSMYGTGGNATEF